MKRMVGGRFQGANDPDFCNSVILYEIKESPGTYFNTIEINTNEKFKYVRYISPEGSSGNIAELEFFDQEDGVIPLVGQVIGTEGSHNNDPERTKDKVFDGNCITFFDAPKADSAWVGLDLGQERNIKKIKFIARTDYNIIVPGNIYEVFYWDKKWISLGKQTAESNILTYSKVPSNALYYIKNHTEGKEERIFTYKNEEQIWW